MTADGSNWNGSPTKLATEVTPVWVTLHNTTGQPLFVQYEEFTLRGSSGAVYTALTPYVPSASNPRPAFEVPNGGYFERFHVAAYLAPHYPWMPVWNGRLPYPPSVHSIAWPANLPTVSVLDRALPEGVLENRGTASGYLYFQKVGAREGGVTFLTELQAPTRRPWHPTHNLASVDIRFSRVSRRWPSSASLYKAPSGPNWMPVP